MADLERQPWGGALRRWAPGDPGARQAARNGTSLRAIRKAGLALLATGTEEASHVMLDALKSEDERVRTVAASQILDRMLGRPGEHPQDFGDRQNGLDTSFLTKEETADALACCERLAGYLALVEVRKRGGGDIETQT